MKTTTTGFLCKAFHESGLRTLGVDADDENHGLSYWREDGELPFPVIGQYGSDLHVQLPGIAGDQYDAMGIDTPPMQAQRGTVASAVRYATHVVVPLAPTPADHARLASVAALIAESGPSRPSGRPPHFGALLVKCKATANSPKTYRKQIKNDGIKVFDVQIADRERYAQAQGEPIRNAMATEFGDLALELMDMEDKKVTA